MSIMNKQLTDGPPSNSRVRSFLDALRYWEPRRIVYNLLLVIVCAAWVFLSWPHFRESLTLQHLLMLTVLALLANACYCAAYPADLFVQRTAARSDFKRWRWVVWTAGTILAIVLANYWIADEIYPSPR